MMSDEIFIRINKIVSEIQVEVHNRLCKCLKTLTNVNSITKSQITAHFCIFIVKVDYLHIINKKYAKCTINYER